jgi:sulfate permease, SulP family
MVGFVNALAILIFTSQLQHFEGEAWIMYVLVKLFFASVTELLTKFDYKENVKTVELNLSRTHIWDDSAVAAVDKIVSKFEENKILVEVKGLNEDSTELVNKLANKLGTH